MCGSEEERLITLNWLMGFHNEQLCHKALHVDVGSR